MMPAELSCMVGRKLKVHGTRKFRVVDANMLPLEPTSSIQALAYAVAERAADIIGGRR